VPKPMTPKVATKSLRAAFPNGHPSFAAKTVNELVLHSNKSHDYSKGGEWDGNFQRVAKILSSYPKLAHSDPRVVALIYMLKQIDAVMWGLNEGIEHKVEGANSRLQDVSVYAKIVQCMNDDRHAGGV
jgi:hypothetical protein